MDAINENPGAHAGTGGASVYGVGQYSTAQSKARIVPDYDAAARFLKLLDESAGCFAFQTFDDNTERKKNNTTDKTLCCVLHGSQAEHWQTLCRLNARGAGIFVTINETNGEGRKADNITRVRAAFEEQDVANKAPCDYPLEPSIEVESSPGKYHRYWLVDGLSLDEYTAIQASIAARYDGDPSAAGGVNRVMRLPGFYHQKEPDRPHMVRITHESGGLPYTAEKIRAAFPPVQNELHKASSPGNGAGKPLLGIEHSEVLRALDTRGHLIGKAKEGGWNILCPWHEQHTTGDDGTIYYEPYTGGYRGHGYKCMHAHCVGKTAGDLLAWLGTDKHAPGDWPEPQPLITSTESEPYPIDALPERIQAAVREVQGFVQAPAAMVASCALSALSLAIQAQVDVKRADKLCGPSSLFFLTIADSGERKSTVDGFFATAIRDYEKTQAEQAKPALKDHKAALAGWDARHAGVKDKIRRTAAQGKSTDSFEFDLRNLERDIPQAPRVPRLLYSDATPEALAYKLANHWPAGGVVSAEAGVVFGGHGMGKDSVMRNLSLLNSLWDGATLTIDRRTSESYTVRGARLTIALQIQEATLREFFERSGTLARGTGFLARFLVAWPESTQGFRPFTEATEHWPALARFNRRITELLEQPVPMGADGALSPVLLSLTPEAKGAWVAFHDAIERSLAAGGELHDVRDVASKAADNAARLAALFQVFAGGGAVGLAAVETASRIVAWHLNESRRFFGELALPEELADAVRLDAWLIKYCQREHTHLVGKRAVQQCSPLRKKDRLNAAIRALVELDRLAVRQDGKRITLAINPALLDVATATVATAATDGHEQQREV